MKTTQPTVASTTPTTTQLAKLFQALPSAFVGAVRPKRDPQMEDWEYDIKFFVGVTFPTLSDEHRRVLEFLLFTRVVYQTAIAPRPMHLSKGRRAQMERSANKSESAWLFFAEKGRELAREAPLTRHQSDFINQLLLTPPQVEVSAD